MKILAAMDIGTNSIRLGVVEVQENETWNTLASQKQVVRLGEGEFAGKGSRKAASAEDGAKQRLTDEAIERGAMVCARFAEVARGYGAEEIIALATAAVREAENQHEFVERVRELADLEVRVISGQEEARLIYLGVRSGIEIPAGKNALIMDIGGGSTELIVGDQRNYHFLDSIRTGAIRLTQEFLGKAEKPVSAHQWEQMTNSVRSSLVAAARAVRKFGYAEMYGSSGTAQNLAEIAAHAASVPVPSSFRNYALALTDVQAIIKRLCSMSLEQRRKIPGINPERADIILGGSAILQTTMETMGAEKILISDRALREGILADRLSRSVSPESIPAENLLYGPPQGARIRSIRQLMRSTRVDEVHAAHIVHLSLRLFDQWKALGLHDYGRARELLEYAALLHDCGFFVSHADHQKHSYYLIRNSELLGFNDGEIELIALLALYHRKSGPRRKHAQYAQLEPKAQKAVRILSCALRLAEALDRGHLGLVENVFCERPPHRNLVRLSLQTRGNAQLERWAAEASVGVFQKTFDMPLEIVDMGDNLRNPL